MRPLHTWAGGKRWLLPRVRANLPKRFRVYREPFFGAGAVFWGLIAGQHVQQAVLSDVNPWVCDLLVALRDYPSELRRALRVRPYPSAFASAKARLNALVAAGDSRHQLGPQCALRAADFLVVVQFCFNGRWNQTPDGRVTSTLGNATNPIPSELRVAAAHKAIQRCPVLVRHQDFKAALNDAAVGDFVYLDPPYDGHWTGYAGKFTDVDLERLASTCAELDSLGVQWLLSQSRTLTVERLFAKYECERVHARHTVGSGSGIAAEELLIRNYEVSC